MAKIIADYSFEQAALARGLGPVAGVDEVGRGPLAGPVTAAAVVLDPARIPLGLADSKVLTAARREGLFAEIIESAVVCVAHASVEEIDSLNILRASHLAMERAVAGLAVVPGHILIDGNLIPAGLKGRAEAIVKGDARSWSIAAASIIAKVTRDRIMVDLAQQHPGYGWEGNAGYPTKQHLDRTGVALLGAIALVGGGVLTPEQAALSVHLPTIVLLFSFMVVSAQMRLGGFYGEVTRRLAALPLGPATWLGLVIAVAAALSAVFTNDIVCLGLAPVLADTCVRRRLDPVPYLLALACASNIGSAATLIGNPQNMLIGSVLGLPFGAYVLQALPPVLASLLLLWVWMARSLAAAQPPGERPARPQSDDGAEPPFDRWQTAKGLFVAAALMLVFLATPWPRDVAALVGAGVLLLSQRFHSSRVMSLVDWELLVLFMGLFVVNHALQTTGLLDAGVQRLQAAGVRFGDPATLAGFTLLLSNLVSNVPAVMLLLPVTGGSDSGALLALVSTLAGNLLIVGSIANIIVVDAARRHGIVIDWRRHARTGVPVTLGSLLLLAAWWVWRA